MILTLGFLGPNGDWPLSAKAEGSLTARTNYSNAPPLPPNSLKSLEEVVK